MEYIKTALNDVQSSALEVSMYNEVGPRYIIEEIAKTTINYSMFCVLSSSSCYPDMTRVQTIDWYRFGYSTTLTMNTVWGRDFNE